MRVRWFGEPWPSAEDRAAICDDDDRRVETPVGTKCIGCAEEIEDGERGVVMAHAGSEDEGYTYWLKVSGKDTYGFGEVEYDQLVCAEHIDCLMRGTAGPLYAELVSRRP